MGHRRQKHEQVDPARIPAVAMLHIAGDAALGLTVHGNNRNHTARIAQMGPDATLGDEALAILKRKMTSHILLQNNIITPISAAKIEYKNKYPVSL